MLFHIKTYQCSQNENIPNLNCFICQGHKSHVSRREKHCMQVINVKRSCCARAMWKCSQASALLFANLDMRRKKKSYEFEYHIQCEKLTSLLQLLIKMKHFVAAVYDLISSIYVRASAITGSFD